MTGRMSAAKRFAAAHGQADALWNMVAGDASNRKYYRLTKDDRTLILMDAPPDAGEDVGPFLAIDGYLRDAGLSAPAVYAADIGNGFLLMEDLGDDLFARILEKDIGMESRLYAAAVDVLVALHSVPAPDLPRYDTDVMVLMARLALDWYEAGVSGQPGSGTHTEFEERIAHILQPLAETPPVLIQRDYHAENLIWLPDRSGVQRVGLLDFQDAMLGHPAYDLVSVLQDARRDVSPSVADAMIARFAAATSVPETDVAAAVARLGLQRNLRILGVFARLCLRDSKPHYLRLVPRVWAHVLQCLDHPDLREHAPFLRAALSEPTPASLQNLEKKCGTGQAR